MHNFWEKITFKRETSLIFRYSFDVLSGFIICLLIQFFFEIIGWESWSTSFLDFLVRTSAWAVSLIVLALIIDMFSGSRGD